MYFLLIILGMMLSLPFSAAAIEQPAYEVVETHGDIEIRQYDSLVVARTRVDASFEKAGSQAFSRLGGYIFGDNRTGEKIAMTAPVSQQPVETGNDSYWVTFFMPSEHTEASLPAPDDRSVNVTTVPPQTYAVLRYRGGWSTKKYQQHESTLTTWLAGQDQWTPSGPAVWARYNPPFIPPFMKTNEVMIPISRSEDQPD